MPAHQHPREQGGRIEGSGLGQVDGGHIGHIGVVGDLATDSYVYARVAQRVLAITAAICHNDSLGLTIHRSVTAYDH